MWMRARSAATLAVARVSGLDAREPSSRRGMRNRFHPFLSVVELPSLSVEVSTYYLDGKDKERKKGVTESTLSVYRTYGNRRPIASSSCTVVMCE